MAACSVSFSFQSISQRILGLGQNITKGGNSHEHNSPLYPYLSCWNTLFVDHYQSPPAFCLTFLPKINPGADSLHNNTTHCKSWITLTPKLSSPPSLLSPSSSRAAVHRTPPTRSASSRCRGLQSLPGPSGGHAATRACDLYKLL